LIREFDTNMYPRESEAFSVPPARGGTASIATQLDLPADYWAGGSDNIVVLVDNVRDANFYDFPENATYIAGFFYSLFNELVDRNVMTIDSYDWAHRTGGDPPNEPVPGDPCASKPARPHLYEGTFAHEYQHLLEYYEDPDETSWINEGLSVYAEALTGYADPTIPVTEIGFDSQLQCFLGWGATQTPANPNPRPGGPENSLTFWGDQGQGDEILCDYGAAQSFIHFLAGRYGEGFISALHDDDANGLPSVRGLLRNVATARDRREIVHDWAAAVALDSMIDHGWHLNGGPYGRYRAPSLDMDVDWSNPDAYSTPGAPPNGSDYVRLRGGFGSFLTARQIRSISFNGSETLPTLPIEWKVDSNPPGHGGNPAVYSGSGPNFDRAIVFETTVPSNDPTLTFATRFDTEPLWDFGFVQISTDEGRRYKSLRNDLTTSDHDPGAIQAVVGNLPGLTGASAGGETAAWVEASFDLSKYKGRSVLIAFRYVTDSGVDLPGWWIDDVKVGGELVSSGESLAGFRSVTDIDPTEVTGFTVQLVGYRSDRPRQAFIHRLKLDSHFDGHIRGRALRRVLSRNYDVVAAVVTYDEPTELIARYAPYRLWVAADDVLQPGGARHVLQRGG
jgi:Immune inhibitor A-like, MAM domain